MQNMQSRFAYAKYAKICTPHFADEYRTFRVSGSQFGPQPARSAQAVQLCVNTEPNLILIRHFDM